jgi:hypothetical protein
MNAASAAMQTLARVHRTRIAPFVRLAFAQARCRPGRSRRLEQKLDLVIENQTRQERMMADNDSAVLERLTQLQQEVATWTTQKGQELADARKALATAIADGRAAQAREDTEKAAAAREAALAKIEEISGSLIQFQPSGN